MIALLGYIVEAVIALALLGIVVAMVHTWHDDDREAQWESEADEWLRVKGYKNDR